HTSAASIGLPLHTRGARRGVRAVRSRWTPAQGSSDAAREEPSPIFSETSIKHAGAARPSSKRRTLLILTGHEIHRTDQGRTRAGTEPLSTSGENAAGRERSDGTPSPGPRGAT